MIDPSYSVEFRTFPKPEDVLDIKKMVTETGFFRPDEVAVAVELAETRIKNGVESGYHFILADLDDKLAGYACYGPVPCSLLSWDLYWIVTKKEHQGKGIGGDLLKKTEYEILKNGGRNIIIETSSRELYKHTQLFYQKYGYSIQTIFKDFYDYGDNKLTFLKQLNP